MAFGLLDAVFPGLGGASGILGDLGAHPAGSTTSTNTSVQDLPDWLKPYVTGNLNAAQGVRDNMDTSSIGSAATPQLLKTINGDYLNSNPYLDQIYSHAAKQVGASVDSRFEGAGRYGSGAHASSLAEPLAGLAASIYGGDYSAERGRQTAATLAAPTFGAGLEQSAFYPYTSFGSLIPNLRTGAGTETSPYFTNPLGTIAGLGTAAAAFL